ncbi:MAG: hypothetical protein F9K27_07205 [Anaerolineae bacterium]|nr:MAG: hypothetical protein F9K27_07205 [Anaerolineae bacterium]
MPEWLTPFFVYFPAYALFFLGVGIPWALALLPREEWRNRVTVFTVGIALGPILSTTWMFCLGTWGTFKIERVLTGVVLLVIVGITAAWLRRYTPYREARLRQEPWTSIEKTLVVMLIIGFAAHVWITMYWPFVQYDTLWTFGYNPRVFLLQERIPDWIDYYPQLVPLTYTYGQLFTGEFNDHVARAAVPWFVFASIMMAYLLGWRVWGRRSIGLLTAALWILMPHSLYWSSAGDLEHPVTLYFTGAVIFFVLAWRSHHWRYAVISGLMFAGAAWTKPTAGAFAFGAILVVVLAGIRLFVPGRWRSQLNIVPNAPSPQQMFRQKLVLAMIVGLSSLPIGLMWYIRNISYDHEAITFPDGYWNDFAQRSGQEFGWLILMAILVVGMVTHRLWSQRTTAHRTLVMIWVGLGLFLAGTLPNALNPDLPWEAYTLWRWVNGARPAAGRLNVLEITLVIVGLAIMAVYLRGTWLKTSDRARSSTLLTAALIAPFTLVWFFSYSYHYRLMLTITPVFAAMTAALIDAWLLPLVVQNRLRQRAAILLTVLLCLPGLSVATWFTAWHVLASPLENDRQKYEVTNPALMDVVAAMEETLANRPRDFLYVYAFGENRLNFFFPHMRTIWDDQRVTELNDLHMSTDLLIGGSTADFLWREDGHFPNQISAYMQLGFVYASPTLEFKTGSIWGMIFRPMLETDDGNNRFVVYEVYTPNRFRTLEEVEPPVMFEDVHWEFIALRGLEVRADVSNDTVQIPQDRHGAFPVKAGSDIYLQLYWQRTSPAPIPYDYSVFVHLVDPATGEPVSLRDGEIGNDALPLTLAAYPDLIPDRRLWHIPNELAPGIYDLNIGFYNPNDLAAPRLTAYQGKTPLGEGLLIKGILKIE